MHSLLSFQRLLGILKYELSGEGEHKEPCLEFVPGNLRAIFERIIFMWTW